MKTAKVVRVQGVRAKEHCDPWLTDRAQRARAEELLRLYPNTTEEETAEILIFLTKGRHFDVGMATGNEEFREKVEAFREAHKQHFRLPPAQVIGVLLLAVVLLGAVIWYFAF